MRNLAHLDRYRVKNPLGFVPDNQFNGAFTLYINGHSFSVIATQEGAWDHVSVAPWNLKRCPTWDEMCAVKDLFFEDEDVVIQLHPRKSQYVNLHEYCLHLWKPNDGEIATILQDI